MASKTSLEQRTLSVPLEDGQTLSIQILELPKQVPSRRRRRLHALYGY